MFHLTEFAHEERFVAACGAEDLFFWGEAGVVHAAAVPWELVHELLAVGAPHVDRAVGATGREQRPVPVPAAAQQVFLVVVRVALHPADAPVLALGDEAPYVPNSDGLVHGVAD